MINTYQETRVNHLQRSPSPTAKSCENLLCKTRTCDSGTGDSVAELPIQPVDYVPVSIYGHQMVAYMANRFDFDMNLVLAYQNRQQKSEVIRPSTPKLAAKSVLPKSPMLARFKQVKSAPLSYTPMIRSHLTDKSSN